MFQFVGLFVDRQTEQQKQSVSQEACWSVSQSTSGPAPPAAARPRSSIADRCDGVLIISMKTSAHLSTSPHPLITATPSQPSVVGSAAASAVDEQRALLDA
eukprot:Selendium_serpulae@DN4886_c0_g1_i1.p1